MSSPRNSNEEKTRNRNLLDGIHFTGQKGPSFGARHAMIIMTGIGSSLISMTSTIFSIILVAMTTKDTSSNPNIPTYNWKNKGLILSSVSWLGIPIRLIAGEWGRKYGYKWFILGACLVNAGFFMFIPFFASLMGSWGVLVCRIVEGIAIGIQNPIAAGIPGIWVPVEERSKAGMISISITFLISMVASVASGPLVATSIGYPGVCYIAGCLNVAWCVAWYFFAHQSPSDHPRITSEEREFIEMSLNTKKSADIPTPWKKLLTSLHFWAPIVSGIGATYAESLMSTVNIIFVKEAWGLNISKSTIILGVGPIAGIVAGVAIAPLSDYLIKKKYLRIVNARRLFNTAGTIGLSLTLIWMTAINGDQTGLIMLNLSLANAFIMMFSVGGYTVNMLDIAPSLAGVTNGFSSTMSSSVALVAPMTIDWIVKDEADKSEWRTIFLISGAIVLTTSVFFLLFASDRREWDLMEDEETDKSRVGQENLNQKSKEEYNIGE